MSTDTKKPGDITHRLRCKYPMGPIGADGEPEFGWRDFSGPVKTTLPTPLMCEAADRIDAQAAEIAEAKGQVEHLDRQNNALRDALQAMVDDFDGCYAENEPAMIQARAALAQHQGEKHGN